MNAQRTETAPAAAPFPGDATAPPPPLREPRDRKKAIRRAVILVIVAALLIYGGIYGYSVYSFGRTHVSTDDAQVDGHIDPVIAHVSGYVTSVNVADNDKVKAGDFIAEIDPRELKIKLEAAEDALKTAEAGLQTAEAGQRNGAAAVSVSEANVKSAQIARDKTASDLARDKNLVAGGAITRQQFETTKAAYDAAAAQLETAQRQVDAVRAQLGVASSQVAAARTQLGQKQNDVDYARLQLSYTRISAPAGGRISKKSIEVGQFVQAGQPLLAITEDSMVWITANFKETDLERLSIGRPVEILVDGYPDAKFEGKVESIAAATGAKFSLLPPDNATGNFVKVTQRVPVKIAITGSPATQFTLRPGMSADVTVSVQ
ncbi:MAG: secretion protein HlyD [Chlorobi bacterium]|nr:secretion protein HlyD [Chlorobiota bacterium]